MDFHRAQEILNSPANIEVLYNQKKVWIHALEPETHSAQISPFNNPEEKQHVPVAELKEGNQKH